MKLKKWLAMILAASLAVGTLGAFAACGEEPAGGGNGGGTTGGGTTGGGGGTTETLTDYYLCGLGLGTLAVSNNWDNSVTDESLKFTRTGNTATITADLYEGDEFGIIHNQAWDDQMGMNIVANEGKEGDVVIFEAGGGYDIKNIKVAEGHSGKYKLTLTLNSESKGAFGENTLEWELLEAYNVVFATWYDVDGTTEIAKTVVKNGTTTTARGYETNKRFYTFDKWVTDLEDKENTAFDFTTAFTESVNLYATIKEVENADYVADGSTWKFSDGTKDLGTLAKSADYTQHNVFTGSLEVKENDEFVITNGTKTLKESDITTSMHAFDFVKNDDNTKIKALKDANYMFTLITECDAEGAVTATYLYFEEIAPTYNGLAIVGTIPGASWSYVDGVNPKMTPVSAGSTIYTGTVVVETATAEAPFKIKVATIVKNAIDWDNSPNWGGPDGNKDNDGNYLIKEPGTYTVTVDTSKSDPITVTLKEPEYYIAGTFLDEQGNQQNFKIVKGLTPKFEKGADGKYTVTFEVKDVSSSFTWIKNDVSNGVFAFKVCLYDPSNTSDDQFINWDQSYGLNDDKQVALGKDGGGKNFYFTEVGTYTVTLDVTNGTVTWTKQ